MLKHRISRVMSLIGFCAQGGAFAVVGGALPSAQPAACGPVPRLAVRPSSVRNGMRIGITYFAGRSKAGDDAHLASALTKELAGQLRAASLSGPAQRQAAVQDKSLIVKLSEGGSFADVDLSITGSVLREGGNLRSQVKLTRSSDGTVIWTGTKSRPITDLPILARLIAQEVATRIGARLAPMPSRAGDSTSAELYELLLRGTYLKSRYDPADLARAVDDFDEAVEMQPAYSKALKLRAEAEMQLVAWGGEGGPREARLVATGLLGHVLERQVEEPERLVDQADQEMRRGQSASACRLVDSAIESDPRSAPAYALRSLLDARGGNIREAFGDAETVTQLGRPLWGDALRAVATIRSGDTTSGRQQAQRVLATTRKRHGAVPFWDARFVAIALSEARLSRDAAAVLARVDARDPRLKFLRDDPALQGPRKSLRSPEPQT